MCWPLWKRTEDAWCRTNIHLLPQRTSLHGTKVILTFIPCYCLIPVLRGSCPNGVVLQHAPRRGKRCDFEKMPMPTPASEINLIETFADTKIIGLTINHEKMNDSEVSVAITRYQQDSPSCNKIGN